MGLFFYNIYGLKTGSKANSVQISWVCQERNSLHNGVSKNPLPRLIIFTVKKNFRPKPNNPPQRKVFLNVFTRIFLFLNC